MKRKRRNEFVMIPGFEHKSMTVREVAEALDVAPSTVRNIVGKHGWAKNGKTTRLNEVQVQTIKDELVPRTLTLKSKVDNAKTSLEIERMTLEVIAWHTDRLKELEKELSTERTRSTELQIRLDENNSYQSIKRFCREHDLEYALSDLQDIGREISSICRARGLPIKKVDDSNFTCVNSYPVEVLREYFFEEE